MSYSYSMLLAYEPYKCFTIDKTFLCFQHNSCITQFTCPVVTYLSPQSLPLYFLLFITLDLLMPVVLPTEKALSIKEIFLDSPYCFKCPFF